MCTTCGCSDEGKAKLTDMQKETTIFLDEQEDNAHTHESSHTHSHPHHGHAHVPEEEHQGHHHSHDHGIPAHTHGRRVILEQEILGKNNRLAERNRGWLAGRKILALNLVSSPGSGKTTLLERTIRDLGKGLFLSVIEGDQETSQDARRIRDTGARVVQINTGTGCHLDAFMVGKGLEQLDPPLSSVVLIENVGNLVCPALFDLGERAKVVIMSVTEGEDKPIKYPHMFRAAEVMLLNKIDLLPYVTFDVERCLEYAHQVNQNLQVVQISATRGDGLSNWYDWLRGAIARGA